MAKPTRPFGGFLFGKDGSVRPSFTTLPSSTKGQEQGVADILCSKLAGLFPGGYKVEILEEADHDFKVVDENGKTLAVGQLTEIVLENYTGPPAAEPDLRFTESYLDGYDNSGAPRFRTVYIEKKNSLLKERIVQKKEKHYSIPNAGEFWLVVWTTQFDYLIRYHQQGKKHYSPAVYEGRKQLLESGSGPFDKVFALNLGMNPVQIWPRLDDEID